MVNSNFGHDCFQEEFREWGTVLGRVHPGVCWAWVGDLLCLPLPPWGGGISSMMMSLAKCSLSPKRRQNYDNLCFVPWMLESRCQVGIGRQRRCRASKWPSAWSPGKWFREIWHFTPSAAIVLWEAQLFPHSSCPFSLLPIQNVKHE